MSQNNQLTLKQRLDSIHDLFNHPATLKRIEEVCSKTVSADRMLKMAYNAISRNELLAKCDRASLLMGVMQAAQDGLEIDGISNEAHLVPYWNKDRNCYEAKYQRGYKGLIKLAKRGCPAIKDIYVVMVYKQDFIELIEGTKTELKHSINLDSEQLDEDIRGGYAVIVFQDGYRRFEYMSKAQIDKIKDQVIARNSRPNKPYSGPWITNYGEQCRKTIGKRACKWLDMPSEVQALIQRDEMEEEDQNQNEPTNYSVSIEGEATHVEQEQHQEQNATAQLEAPEEKVNLSQGDKMMQDLKMPEDW